MGRPGRPQAHGREVSGRGVARGVETDEVREALRAVQRLREAGPG